jgi:hypothetical protein
VNTVGEVEGTKDSLGSRSYYYNLHSVWPLRNSVSALAWKIDSYWF